MTICPRSKTHAKNARAKARANGARSLRVVQPLNRSKSQRIAANSQRGARDVTSPMRSIPAAIEEDSREVSAAEEAAEEGGPA